MTARRAPAEPVQWRWTNDAAAYVGLGRDAFNRAVAKGEISPISDEGHRRYLVADLDAYVLRKRRPSPVKQPTPITTPPASAAPPTVIQLPRGINKATGRPYGAAR